MHARPWWAIALAGTLAGCIVESGLDDPPGWDDDPSEPRPDPSNPRPQPSAPDFRVELVSGPSALGTGEQRVQARLCNDGAGSGMTDAAFFLTASSAPGASEFHLGASPRFSLRAGECREVSASVSARAIPEGDYFLSARVDPDGLVTEDSEGNNVRLGNAVFVDRTPPPTPAPTWAQAGTGSTRALTLHTEAGATVRVYQGPGCTGTEVGSTVANAGNYCEVPISVPNGPGARYSARAYDAVGNASQCSPAVDYPYGPGTPRMAPVLLSTSPTSPGGSMQPVFHGRAEPRVTVEVFRTANCQGPVEKTVTTDDIGLFYAQVSVAKNAKVTVSARATAAGGYDSASTCSNPLEYQHDGEPPEPPRVTDVKWQYLNNGQQLVITGTAEPHATVGIFVDVACTGTPTRTVQADAQGRFSTVAPFGPGGSHRVFLAAKDACGNVSTCAEGPAYELRCPPGTADCDGRSSNGCEADLTANPNHCGTCGNSCQDGPYADGVCVAATCGQTCVPGYYDCDGKASNGCESRTVCQPTNTCTIDKPSELMITHLSVVEDPVRTAPGGAWHFGTVMRELNGGQDPSELVRAWLKTWLEKQHVNGLTIPPRPEMQTKVLGPWETRSGGPSKPLDFNSAPFRLLAIVNRIDLREQGVTAGEGRFIYGVVAPNGEPLEFTVILEYALPGTTPESIQRWASDWHALGAVKVGNAGYNAKLQALTDRFVKAGVMTGRHQGSALNQIRTNEIELEEPWELREFVLSPLGLMPTTMKLTPANHFENTQMLASYLTENSAAVLEERHTVPDSMGGIPFLGAHSLVPLDFFWRAPNVSNEVRHKFSLNTCSGCHAGETQTEFVHVSARASGRTSTLSPYLRGTTVTDPVTKSIRTFDDLTRRAEDLKALVCAPTTGLKSVGLAPSNLPRARVH
ncbi:CARDB domain-containing protein [Myxococcus faecalis]|uniref:CARDB domain-containing protein n=1 Tax=Myxococcus faecalis TaxID=3115646 RepID=UPI003CE9899B